MANDLKANNLPPFPIIPTQPVSGNVTSLVTDIFKKDNINVQFVWDGTLAGAFTAETSDDYIPAKEFGAIPIFAGNWAVLPLGAALASGTPDTGVFDLNALSARFLRVIFTHTGGAGNLTATITGKAV